MIAKRILHATSLILFAASSFAAPGRLAPQQEPVRSIEVDFRVKRIGLESSHAQVLRQLGRPRSSKREKVVDKYEVCGPPYTSLALKYEGLVIKLMGDLRWRNFKVVSMEVTSPRVRIAPGIKIGMTEKEIRSRLGPPWQEREESGHHIIDYVKKGTMAVRDCILWPGVW